MNYKKYESIESAKAYLAEKLKGFAADRKLSYRAIARCTRLAPSYISGLMKGDYMPSLVTVFKMAECFGVEYSELLKGFELYITPSDFEFKHDGDEVLENYSYMIAVSKAYTEFHITMEEKNDDAQEGSFTKMIVKDDSMSALGIKRGSQVTYENVTEFVNDRIYVLEYKGEFIVRRIWKSCSRYIIIPVASEWYPILECEVCDVKIVGIVKEVVNVLI